MKKPNFFIIGAPKCGTTSLAAWLGEHPQIYMSPVKEPHHFNLDDGHVITPNRLDYEYLFAEAEDRHIAIGEASVWYLYSHDAVPEIEKYTNGNARYIVCLRNPVEMAYSLHAEQVAGGNENIVDFEIAWDMQDKRSRGDMLVDTSHAPSHLLYGEVCSLGKQVGRLYRCVPKERILPILLDDIKEKPQVVYDRICEFLSIDFFEMTDFPVLNKAKSVRNMMLHRLVKLMASIKNKLNIQMSLGVLAIIKRYNIKETPRKKMSREMQCKLECYYSNDIGDLGCLIGRDLGFWLGD